MEKAIHYKKWGGAVELLYDHLPAHMAIDPDSVKLGRGEILVRVHAISINPIDWKILSGSQKAVASGRFPRIFGTDFSGIVYRSGSRAESKGYAKGTRVMGLVSPLNKGAGRQWLKVKNDHCIIIPGEMTMEEGASLPEAGISALIVTDFARKRKNGNVLVFGATGGVGSLAVQVLIRRGWEVTAVCRRDQRSQMESLGCSRFIDRENWKEELAERSSWDAIVDCPGVLIRESPRRFLKRSGVYFPVFIPDAFIPGQILRFLLWQFTSYSTGIFLGYPSGSRMRKLERLITSKTMVPVIENVTASEEINHAVLKSQEGGNFGKLIVRLD